MAKKLVKRMPRSSIARAASPASSVAMGSIGYGAGGPTFLDEFHSKRAPRPTELVDAYKALAYACIQLNAQGVARVPLRLYAKTGSGDRKPRRQYRSLSRTREKYLRQLPGFRRSLGGDVEISEIVEHQYLDALESPCPYFDGSAFIHYAVTCLDAIGSFYFVPIRPDPKWAANEWWPLLSQYVMPIKSVTPGEVLGGYTFFGQNYRADEVERIRFISLRDPYLSGYPPLHACFEQVKLNNHYTAVVDSILDNDAQIGLLGTPSNPALTPGDDVRKRYQTELNAALRGGNRSRVLLTNGAWTFTRMQMPPSDLSGLEITKTMRLLVANCFGVPISLLQSEDSNRAVAEAGNYQHQRNAIEPRCVLIAGALTAMAKRVDPRLFFAFDNPVEADEVQRTTVIDMKLKNGSMVINESREEDGRESVSYGDEPWQSSTLVQPTAAAEEREKNRQLAEQIANKPAAEEEPKPVPDPEEEPPAEKPAQEDDELQRTLLARLDRITRRWETRLEAQDAEDRDDSWFGKRHAGIVRAQAGGGPGAGEHVRPAPGTESIPGDEEVVREAEGGSPGDDSQSGNGAGDALPAPDQLRRQDGSGDDAPDRDLLGRSGEANEGEAGAGS